MFAELFINRFRLIALALVYGVHWLNVRQQISAPGADLQKWDQFNQAVTAIVGVWVLAGLLVAWVYYSRKWVALLPWITSALDAVLMFLVLNVANGPASPLVIFLPLILALRGVHGELRILRWSLFCTSLCYLAAAYVTLPRAEAVVPGYAVVYVCLALLGVHVVLSQIIRRDGTNG